MAVRRGWHVRQPVRSSNQSLHHGNRSPHYGNQARFTTKVGTMRRSLTRFLAIPVAAAASSRAWAFAATPALADVTGTGGSATLSVPLSYLAQLGHADIKVKASRRSA